MDANKAMELGFADEVLKRESATAPSAMLYSENIVNCRLWNKLAEKYKLKEQGRPVDVLMRRLSLEKKFM